MENKKYSNITENKKIYIAGTILVVLLLASIISLLIMRTTKDNRSIATIYIDGSEYTTIDLSSCEDKIFTITASNGSKNTIEIKDHNIRMHSAECKNNLCVKQGWANDTLLPIVCLPNNVIITVSNSVPNEENEKYDAITY